MGAAAFIMADLIGLPYLTVALAAIVPAALYYYNLYLSVVFEARKQNIQPIPLEDRPKITRDDLFKSLQFLIPIVVGLMVAGFSVPFAGVCATAAVLVVGFALNEELRREPKRILVGLVHSGRSAAGVVIAVGSSALSSGHWIPPARD